MPNILSIQIFANKSYARIRDFNETEHKLAKRIHVQINFYNGPRRQCLHINKMTLSSQSVFIQHYSLTLCQIISL